MVGVLPLITVEIAADNDQVIKSVEELILSTMTELVPTLRDLPKVSELVLEGKEIHCYRGALRTCPKQIPLPALNNGIKSYHVGLQHEFLN